MLFGILKKKKPKVFLGHLIVVQRDSWREDFDSWGLFKSYNLEEALMESLKAFINLPPITDIESHDKRDLGLELAVVDHQGGEFDSLISGACPFPIFWRPKVCVKGRLYNLSTGKTVCIASKTARCGWWRFITRVVSINGLFRYKPLFNKNDMEMLLCKASFEVLTKLKRKI